MFSTVIVSRQLSDGTWHRSIMHDVYSIETSLDVGICLKGNAHLILLRGAPKPHFKRWKGKESIWEIKLYGRY